MSEEERHRFVVQATLLCITVFTGLMTATLVTLMAIQEVTK